MVIREAKAARNADSLLGNIDVAGIVGRLMELVDIDKIYRDPEISIQSLSILLEINTYQLSIILNEKMNMNFRAFINFYRLGEAQQLLTLEPGKTILEIAFEVGFNSKTSFNTLFSKETGLSPREYRKKFVNK
jgi:AraC-like DNA-binding protein